jgi:hypothetical protein
MELRAAFPAWFIAAVGLSLWLQAPAGVALPLFGAVLVALLCSAGAFVREWARPAAPRALTQLESVKR